MLGGIPHSTPLQMCNSFQLKPILYSHGKALCDVGQFHRHVVSAHLERSRRVQSVMVPRRLVLGAHAPAPGRSVN